MNDIIAQQSGGGMLGGLPASWQYTNPESLTPEQKQMMALVGTQNPEQAGFNPLAATPGAFPTGGAAPIAGTDNPLGMLPQMPAPAAAAPVALPPVQSLELQDSNAAQGFGMDVPPIGAPAAPKFGAGASPVLFANPPGSTPGNPALPSPAPAPAADNGEEDAPAANAPASPAAIGGYQMPRIGSAASFAPDPAALPVNAQATEGRGFPGSPAAPAAAPSIGDNLMTGYQNLHHGGGLIGSIVAAVTGKRNDATGVALQQQQQVANMTARALIAKGVDPQVAMAAVQPGNGEALKELFKTALMGGTHTSETDKDGNVWDVDRQTGKRTIALAAKDDKFQHFTTKNFDGSETPHVFNTKTGEDKVAGGADGPGGAKFGSLLAQGVQYDPNKSGDSYMAQFSPEVQAAAKHYINGDIMPTGNARRDAVATFAKTVALKWGQDTGVPVSDTTYMAKRKMQTDLASSGNSSMGGILSNGESSFKHLAEYAKSAADQGNMSLNFPLGGAIAHKLNYASNAGGGSDTQGKVKAINDNLGKYGAESTKFYAGTGGGVEERLNALKEMNATETSGEEAAAYAEKEKNLMLDRLNTKFQEIRNTLGEERGNAEIAKHMPDIERNVAAIDANVARLRGKAPTAKSTPTDAPPPAPGAYVWSPDKGLAAAK